MAERLAYLEAVVGADVTQFRKGMRDIRNEVGFLSETMSGIAGLGRSLTFAFTTPVLALGTAAINVASSFEASMYNINSIAGLSGEALDELGQKTLEFGARTRAGAQAASEALYTVFSAGITNVDDAFAVMQVATRTAEAGLADLTITTEGLVAILLSYGDTSEAAAMQASDAITRMVALGVGSMQTFMTSLSSVVPTASAIGMEFEDLAADMAFLTQRGLSAARAGVSMNAVLTQMLNPTEAMTAAFGELGARSLPDLIEQFGGVNEAIMAVIGTADGDVSQLFEMFNSIQARRAIGLFAEGQEAWQQTLAEFEQGVAGSTTRAWEEQMKSFAATWDLLMSAVTGAGIAIGSTALPVLQPFVAALTDLLLVIVDTNPEILGMGAAFLTVAAAIPPLLWLIGSLVTPFGLVLGAVSALGVAFATDFAGIATAVKTTVDTVIAELQPLIDSMQTLWRDIFPEELTLGEIVVDGTLVNPMDTITVEAPSSLWDIYVNRGYADRFTWDAFMEAALAGGWDGAVIDVGELITIEGDPFESVGTGVDALNDFQDSLDTVQPATLSLWDKIAQGVANVWPAMQAQLDVLWDNFKVWLDETGSGVITAIAGWFTEGAGTNIYTAFTELLQGDITGAINAVIPNAGTEIANVIGEWDLSSAFPKISTALSMLFNNIGNWLVSTAIPLLAQSAGFLSGKIATLLFNAVNAAINFFSSGGASDTANAIGQYVDESVADPFATGFAQAIEGTELSSALESIGTALDSFFMGIENTLSTSPDLQGLRDFGDGLRYFWDKVTGADWTGLKKIASNIANFFTTIFGNGGNADGLVGAGNNFDQSILSGLGDSFTALGDAVTNFANIFNNLVNGDFSEAMDSAEMMFADLGIAVLGVPVSILDEIIDHFERLTGLELPDVGQWLDDVRTSLTGASTNLFVKPVAQLSFFSLDQADRVRMEAELEFELQESLREITEGLGVVKYDGTIPYAIEGIDVVWDEITLENADALVDIANDPNASQALKDAANAMLDGLMATMSPEDAFVVMQMRLGVTEVIVTPEGVVYHLDDAGNWTIVPPTTPITTDTTVPLDAPVAITYDMAQQQGLITGTGTPEPVTTDTTIPVIAPIEITPLSTSFADDLAGGQTVDSIIAENFVPLEEAWVAMFAPEGAMQTTFNTFSGAIALGWQNIENEINDFVSLINTDVPTAMTTFESAKDPFIESLNTMKTAIRAAKDEVSGLKSELEGLLALESTMNVTITVTANQADGSHKTGLMSVPYDGYMAELHKGEMVLTKNEANQYRDADVSAEAAMPQTQVKGGDTYENKVTIQGNLTVDQMLFELKRRGIDLTKVK